jgi:integrase
MRLRMMKAAAERAGLKGKILYGLRHSFATAGLVAGVSDTQVAALLGHSNTTMLHKHYSHIGEQYRILTAAVKKFR